MTNTVPGLIVSMLRRSISSIASCFILFNLSSGNLFNVSNSSSPRCQHKIAKRDKMSPTQKGKVIASPNHTPLMGSESRSGSVFAVFMVSFSSLSRFGSGLRVRNSDKAIGVPDFGINSTLSLFNCTLSTESGQGDCFHSGLSSLWGWMGGGLSTPECAFARYRRPRHEQILTKLI